MTDVPKDERFRRLWAVIPVDHQDDLVSIEAEFTQLRHDLDVVRNTVAGMHAGIAPAAEGEDMTG